MLYREIIAVCSQIHTKHINILCGQNVELLNVKLVVLTVSSSDTMLLLNSRIFTEQWSRKNKEWNCRCFTRGTSTTYIRDKIWTPDISDERSANDTNRKSVCVYRTGCAAVAGTGFIERLLCLLSCMSAQYRLAVMTICSSSTDIRRIQRPPDRVLDCLFLVA